MENEKVTFIQAENGIIVEIQEKNWDGHSVKRKLFQYPPNAQPHSIRLTTLKAIEFAFPADKNSY